MPSLCYLNARHQQADLALRAERARQAREGQVPEPRRRSPRLADGVITAPQARQPTPASAPSRC